MKCFYHPVIDAVAICKSCSKGLCPECAADVGNGIACKNKCEAEVRALNEQILRGRTLHLKGAEGHAKTAVFSALAGIFFVLFALFKHDEFAFVFILPLGLIFLVCALLFYQLARKFKRSN